MVRGAALSLPILLLVAAPAAAARPKLVVSAVSARPAVVAAGGRLTVGAVVRNRGRGKAKPSRAAILLSRDRRRGGDVRLATRRVAALRPRAKRRVDRAVTIPATTMPGTFRMLVCAGRRCAASGAVRVTAPAGGPPAPPPPPAPRTPGPPTPEPPKVELDLDAAHAATGTLDETGGTLRATGADGTVFTLTLPAGALVSAEDITLTPVKGIGGLPFHGGMDGAVQLEPDGLKLLTPGTLKIEPAALHTGERAVGFAWEGDGRRLHMEPVGDGVSLAIWHFSGHGAAGASANDVLDQLGTIGLTPEQVAMQRLADILDSARRCGESDPVCGNAYARNQQAVLRDWLRDGVLPGLEIAAHDKSYTETAVQQAMHWAHLAAQHDPVFAAEIEEVSAAVGKLVEAAYDDAADRCAGGDLSAIDDMAVVGREGLLLGWPIDESKLASCATFTVQVDSDFKVDNQLKRITVVEGGPTQVRTNDDVWRAHASIRTDAVATAPQVELLPTYADWHHHELFKNCDTFDDGRVECLGRDTNWTANLGDPEFRETLPVTVALTLKGANPKPGPATPPEFVLRLQVPTAIRTSVLVQRTIHDYNAQTDSTDGPTTVEDAGWYSGYGRLYYDERFPTGYADLSTPGCGRFDALRCMRYEIGIGTTVVEQSSETGDLADTGTVVTTEKTTITLGHG